MVAPYRGLIEEIHVMLVDLDKEIVDEMVVLLKASKYKVMTIDAMIINVHSPYFLSLEAVALNIISLFVCDEHKEHLVMKAFSIGAYMYLNKSLDKDIVNYLWQFVLSERIKKEKYRKGLEENMDQINVADIINNIVRDIEEQAKNDVVSNGKYKPRKKRDRKSMKESNEGESQGCDINTIIRRKIYTNWTPDLHAKFIEAMQQLGEGRCLPKKILNVMNEPSLTRTQIASHLQKCRNDTWKAPKKKNIRHCPAGQKSSSDFQQRWSINEFETISHFQENIFNRGLEFSFPTLNSNNIISRGESSIQQLYRPQHQIQPHYLNIENSLNSSFFPAQNVACNVQEQHYPLFGMLKTQGPYDLIIGSTDYKPELAFNDEDHYDHNLNVNAVNITTHSGSTMIADIHVKNVIVSGLGEANTNFQQYFGEQNMSDPSSIIAAPDMGDSNEKTDCDVNFDFHFDINDEDFDEMNLFIQNLELPSSNLPNEHSSEFDQAYFADQSC